MYKKAAIFFRFAEGRILETIDPRKETLQYYSETNYEDIPVMDVNYEAGIFIVPATKNRDIPQEPVFKQEKAITFHEEIAKIHRDIFSGEIPFDKKAYLDFWTMARDYVRTFQESFQQSLYFSELEKVQYAQALFFLRDANRLFNRNHLNFIVGSEEEFLQEAVDEVSTAYIAEPKFVGFGIEFHALKRYKDYCDTTASAFCYELKDTVSQTLTAALESQKKDGNEANLKEAFVKIYFVAKKVFISSSRKIRVDLADYFTTDNVETQRRYMIDSAEASIPLLSDFLIYLNSDVRPFEQMEDELSYYRNGAVSVILESSHKRIAIDKALVILQQNLIAAKYVEVYDPEGQIESNNIESMYGNEV